eukprot:NODE_13512_length_1161_cov_4.868472.p1 GENE.NODE_13512_length_1161_cov_4.868472~~NODE_13512_length_1161_cov_4.868472.p1  ORF type:complete len:276 (+),score=89.01 NODE_13512_length_1161_cov_4.868472:87-830(+)
MAGQRARRAVALNVWNRALDDLREDPLSAVTVHSLWAYAALAAPLWRLPGCFAAMGLLFALLVARAARKDHSDRPLVLYKDEIANTAPDKGFTERHKQRFTSALSLQLSMMQFAERLNAFAVTVEKVSYVLTLRDPYLSLLTAFIFLGAVVYSTVALFIFTLFVGYMGIPLLVWGFGCMILLPRRARVGVVALYFWGKERKKKIFGSRGTIFKKLRALWRRIPDGHEQQHCDLVDHYILGTGAPRGV